MRRDLTKAEEKMLLSFDVLLHRIQELESCKQVSHYWLSKSGFLTSSNYCPFFYTHLLSPRLPPPAPKGENCSINYLFFLLGNENSVAAFWLERGTLPDISRGTDLRLRPRTSTCAATRISSSELRLDQKIRKLLILIEKRKPHTANKTRNNSP